MRMFISAGDSPLAPRAAGALGEAGQPHQDTLLELVLSLAQIQYEMESRRRRGLPADDLRAAEDPIIEALHRRGVPIPQRAPRVPHGRGTIRPSPGAPTRHQPQ